MVYTPHMALDILYSLPGGETASNTLRYRIPSGAFYTSTDLNDAADAAMGPITTHICAVDGRLSAEVSVERIDLRHIGADGRTITLGQSSLAAVPGVSPVNMPTEVAVCISLRTGNPGRSGRGRIYAPCLAVSMGAGGVIGAGQTSAMSNAWKSAIAGAAAALDTSLGQTTGTSELVVASGVDGVNYAVTSLRIGDVPDVQRRRRNGLAETYAILAYP